MALIKNNFISHLPPSKANIKQVRYQSHLCMRLKQINLFSLCFIVLFHVSRQRRNNSSQANLSQETPSPNSSFSTQHLTDVSGAPRRLHSDCKTIQSPYHLCLLDPDSCPTFYTAKLMPMYVEYQFPRVISEDYEWSPIHQ